MHTMRIMTLDLDLSFSSAVSQCIFFICQDAYGPFEWFIPN